MQCLTGVDRLAGRLRNKLQQLELDKNTIIIFTSDHGLFMASMAWGKVAVLRENDARSDVYFQSTAATRFPQ